METLELAKLRANIPKLYAFAFFQTFLVAIPVLVPFFETHGLNVKDVFLLQGIFGATLIVFDVPAGYLADYFGRKKTMILGSAVSAVGFQVLWLGTSFAHFAVFEIIIGLGLSLQSGSDIAILYSSLDRLKLEGRKARYLGRRLTSMTVGEGVASLLGGALALVSLKLPAQVNGLTACMPLLISCLVYEPGGESLGRGSHRDNMKMIVSSLFAHSRLLTLAILNFIFYGFATYCAVWSLQPYWKARGLDVAMFGVLWAANSFMVALVGRYAHAIEEKLGSVAVVVTIAVLPVIGYFGMGLSGGLWGLLFTLAFPICRGLNQVIFQDAINTRVPAAMRATTNSVGSLGTRALFIVFGPLLGYVLDTAGPNQAMLAMGGVYFVGLFAVALPLLRERHAFTIELEEKVPDRKAQ